MRRTREYRKPEEPLTVTLDTVKDTLLYHGYERQAGLIDVIQHRLKTFSTVEADYREQIVRLLERLHVYEPSEKPTHDRNGKPSEMSDG